jgi:hypothetical protein
MKLTDPLIFFLLPGEKKLKTVWKVEMGGKKNYLVGTAHFFPYHFRVSLKKILRRSKRALFEGPLDPQSMEKVVAHGSQGKGSLEIYEALDSQTLREIREKAASLFGDPSSGIRESRQLFGDSQTLSSRRKSLPTLYGSFPKAPSLACVLQHMDVLPEGEGMERFGGSRSLRAVQKIG